MATTVTLTVRKPDGTVEEVEIEEAAVDDEALAEAATGETLTGVTGVYRADIDLDMSGTWRYRWDGVGALQESGSGRFRVQPDLVGQAE
jgi:hypothetical protein